MTTVQIKRAYEPKKKSDGFRILVDRLWPRGIKKEDLDFDMWLKEIGPSPELRKWFAHDADKWNAFKIKYKTELLHSVFLEELLTQVKQHTTVTLIYSAKDEQHNQAVVLKEVLQEHL